VLTGLAAFSLAAALLTVSPGLDTALVLHTAAREGAAAAWRAALGIALGCLAWGVLAAAGLSAALLASSTLFATLRLAGAAYLVWLGIALLWDSTVRSSKPVEARGATPFRRGLLTNLLNPKVGLFYVAFLPQFIPPGGDVLALTLAMAAIHAALGLAWFALLIGATRKIGPWLARPAVSRTLDRLTGGLFVALGAKLALNAR